MVESPRGSFVLKRHLDTDRASRLTVAALAAVRSIAARCNNCSPNCHRRWSPNSWPSILPKLRRSIGFWAKILLANLPRRGSKHLDRARSNCKVSDDNANHDTLDRRRIDELIRQRDFIAESIENQLSMRRQEGGVLSGELAEVENSLETTRRQLEDVQADLRVVTGEIAECETRLRYVSLESIVTATCPRAQSRKTSHELANLKVKSPVVAKHSADLQARDAVVARNLRSSRPMAPPTESAIWPTAARRLASWKNWSTIWMRKLRSWPAPTNRAAASVTILTRNSHPSPPCCGNKFIRLCGLVTEQERFTRRQQLTTESRQISRSQLDLGERLEHLLERRELARPRTQCQRDNLSCCGPNLRRSNIASASTMLSSSATPIRCWSALPLGILKKPISADTMKSCSAGKMNCRVEADDLTGQLADLEAAGTMCRRERAGLVGNASLEELRFQLEQLEIAIREALRPVADRHDISRMDWRASDILAQLTDGKLVQIRLERDGREPIVVDHLGQAHDLGRSVRQPTINFILSLTLALVGSFARRGIYLPLVLDEPFLRQDAAGSAAMAGLLCRIRPGGSSSCSCSPKTSMRCVALNRSTPRSSIWPPSADKSPRTDTGGTRVPKRHSPAWFVRPKMASSLRCCNFALQTRPPSLALLSDGRKFAGGIPRPGKWHDRSIRENQYPHRRPTVGRRRR